MTNKPKNELMSVEEFLSAISEYFNAPMSRENYIFTIVISIIGIISLFRFILYSIKESKRVKEDTDQFTIRMKGDDYQKVDEEKDI